MLTVEEISAVVATRPVTLASGKKAKVRSLAAEEVILLDRAMPAPEPPMRRRDPADPLAPDPTDPLYVEQNAMHRPRRVAAQVAVMLDLVILLPERTGPELFASACERGAAAQWAAAAAKIVLKKLTETDIRNVWRVGSAIEGPGALTAAMDVMLEAPEGSEPIRIENGKAHVPAEYDLTETGVLAWFASVIGRDPMQYIKEFEGRPLAERAMAMATATQRRIEDRRTRQLLEEIAGVLRA